MAVIRMEEDTGLSPLPDVCKEGRKCEHHFRVLQKIMFSRQTLVRPKVWQGHFMGVKDYVSDIQYESREHSEQAPKGERW